jgi:hypothetical protein
MDCHQVLPKRGGPTVGSTMSRKRLCALSDEIKKNRSCEICVSRLETRQRTSSSFPTRQSTRSGTKVVHTGPRNWVPVSTSLNDKMRRPIQRHSKRRLQVGAIFGGRCIEHVSGGTNEVLRRPLELTTYNPPHRITIMRTIHRDIVLPFSRRRNQMHRSCKVIAYQR